MSALDSLLERVRSAYAAVSETEAVAARFPGDRFVLANLTSLRRNAQRLEAEWEEASRARQIEICRYRLIGAEATRYALNNVARSLLDFQELFSQIYDALKNGAKQRARISSPVRNETEFDFAFTYPGSLGVALTVASEATLFGAKYDDSIDAFFQLMHIESEHQVRDAAKSLGDAVVKKAFEWSKINYAASYDADHLSVFGCGVHAAAGWGSSTHHLSVWSSGPFRRFRERKILAPIVLRARSVCPFCPIYLSRTSSRQDVSRLRRKLIDGEGSSRINHT